MSDNMEDYFTLEMAYNILLKEYQISSLQEIPYDTYQRLWKKTITQTIGRARFPSTQIYSQVLKDIDMKGERYDLKL